jgi:hypothetical protein
MKRFLSIRSLMLTVMLLMGTIPVAAIERPFSLTGSGIAAFITDGAGHVIGANVTGSGTATHLGLYTTVARITFTPDPDNPILVHPGGEATLTAANGDKLNLIVVDGVMDVTTGIGTGHFRFVGGTGRFANASGITENVVVQNLVTGAFELTVVGSIDF